MARIYSLVFSIVVTASALAASANNDYEPPPFISAPVEVPDEPRAERLSLRAAVVEAIENNLGVELARIGLSEAQVSRLVSAGRFEPVLTGSYSRFDALSPPSTAQEGAAGQNLSFKSDSWTAGLSHGMWTGTRLSLEFSNTRSRSSLGTAVDPLIYRSGLELRATQSLLRGFSLDLDIPRVDILRAEIASDQAEHQVRGQMMATIEATETAYWGLVESLKNYQVEQASTQRAQEQLNLTKKQIDSGLLAPASLLEAESSLAQRKLALVQAEAAIRQSNDQLVRTLGRRNKNQSRALFPVDQPSFEPKLIEVERALEQARSNRPDVQAAQLAIERARLDQRFADNDRLPDLDVTFGYGLVGQDSTYGSTLDNLVSNDSRSWSLAVNFSWTPIGRVTRAQQELATLRAARARSTLENSLDDIELEVRNAVRDVETAARALQAAALFRDLSDKSLSVEERKFVAGTSSNFLVAQRQDALRQAQLAELRALIRHKVARIRLERATGLLLGSRSIETGKRAAR